MRLGTDHRRLVWWMLGLYLLGLGISATLRMQGDFAVYYLAGQRALSGAPLYQTGDSSPYLYAPVLAFVFLPFGMLPRHAAQLAWFVVNAAALIAVLAGAGRLLFPARRLPAALIIVPVALCFRFINNNFDHGQINLPVLALVLWALADGLGGGAWRAGAWLAIAVLIKPFAILAALYLLVRGRIAVLLYAALSGLALLAAPALLHGPSHALSQLHDYLAAVAAMGDRYRFMITNQSASSAAIRLFSAPAPAAGLMAQGRAGALGLGFDLILLAAVLGWNWRTAGRPTSSAHRLALCALFCLMPSLAPVSWKSYYVTLLVPYMELCSVLWIDRDPAPTSTLGLCWALIALSFFMNLVNGGYLNHLALYYSVHFFSSLVVLAALAVTARKLASDEPAWRGEASAAGVPLRGASSTRRA